MPTEKILITGANGQLGAVLAQRLSEHYGDAAVIASDIRPPQRPDSRFVALDVTDQAALAALVRREAVTHIYHLAAILSAKGEAEPLQTWHINMQGLLNVLEVSRQLGVQKVYYPSSIAVFGGMTPQIATPQHAVLQPQTVYGISKEAGEHWCNYYWKRYGLDVRSLRYPGLIGYESLPGGGTTDYAVEIFHKAVRGESFACFLRDDTRLPMMYMPDAIRATLELMEAPAEAVRVRTSYNVAGMSFTPAEVFAAIQRHRPDFQIHYAPDFRQAIAESWPSSIDDSAARADWGWQERYDLDAMTADMLLHLGSPVAAGQ